MSFSVSPTRNIQAGDTPNLNDGLLSRPMVTSNITRGLACVITNSGLVAIATDSNTANKTPFVPIESKNNSGGEAEDLEMEGVGPGQIIALKVTSASSIIRIGNIVQISSVNGEVIIWNKTNNSLRYAVYIGKDAAVLNKNDSTPFEESLSSGVVPDTSINASEIGWFRLLEGSAD